jgi:DNA-binding CsgD family transcriptional regulator
MPDNFFDRLFRRLGFLPPDDEPLRFELEQPYNELLHILADAEQRPAEQVAADLLMGALAERHKADLNLALWRLLSPREQEVAALICLNHTNKEIAARLGLSPETVKTHVHNLLGKYRLRSRAELRQALADWDFSAWG